MSKKGFKDTGADLFFSINDAPPSQPAPIAPPPMPKAPQTAENKRYSEILEGIKSPDKPPGASVTFYLDRETINAISEGSKLMSISRSKLVNKILKQVLINS
jgi:hypothetical protein